LQLMADIFFDVLESVEKSRRDSRRSSAILDARAEILLAGVHQATIGVVNDHDLFGAEQMVRHDQGTERIFGYDAASVANDVRVTGFEAQSANGEPGVHAGEDGEFTRGPGSERAQLVRARVNFIGGENFVDDAHFSQAFRGGDS